MGELDEFEGPADFPPPPVLPAYLGALLMQFSYADTATHFLIWRILGVTLADGRSLTGRLDTRPRINLLETLCERHIAVPSRKEQVLAATRALTYASEYRNMAAHGDWRTRKTGQLVCFSVQYDVPGEWPFAVKPVDLPELTAAAADCDKAMRNLWDVDAWLKVTPRGSW
jgi:hypothetical protein